MSHSAVCTGSLVLARHSNYSASGPVKVRFSSLFSVVCGCGAAHNVCRYDEPPTQFFPSRHFLGASLLRYGAVAAAGQATSARGSAYVQEAVDVYEHALIDYPNNGWALHGLTAAFEAGGVASIRKIAAVP